MASEHRPSRQCGWIHSPILDNHPLATGDLRMSREQNPSSEGDRFWRVLSVLAVTGMLVAVGNSLWGRFVDRPTPRDAGVEQVEPSLESQFQSAGRRLGGAQPLLTVVEFGDYECPACRMFHVETVEPLLREYPQDLAVIYRHTPIPGHRFAYPAARAAECAAHQDRFAEYHDLLFQKQDSIGLKDWESFAAEAGVSDSLAFAACVRNTDLVPEIEADLEAGRQAEARGTPTVIVAGKKYPGVVTYRDLKALLDSVRAERSR